MRALRSAIPNRKAFHRITCVVNVDNERIIEQITKQLNKQIDVLKVTDITDQCHRGKRAGVGKSAGHPKHQKRNLFVD